MSWIREKKNRIRCSLQKVPLKLDILNPEYFMDCHENLYSNPHHPTLISDILFLFKMTVREILIYIKFHFFLSSFLKRMLMEFRLDKTDFSQKSEIFFWKVVIYSVNLSILFRGSFVCWKQTHEPDKWRLKLSFRSESI